ncbi:MAG: hypothetical protein JWO38_1214 [Gemmataceae bacterium]|nr:hypothetical protein [Gemmataceae bacterium]
MNALMHTQPTTPHTLLTGLSRKEQAVTDVIAGRVSLLEAAARFGAAGEARPDTDGEALCRSVIGWVHLALRDRPERADLVAGRLEHELQDYRAQLGHLPTPV